MGLGVFIEPKGKLRSKILNWKKKIAEEFKEQPYTNHPPHLTIIHSDVKRKKAVISKIKEGLFNTQPLNLTIKKNNVFWNDSLTGGHTLYLNIEKNKHLQNIQIKLSSIFSLYKKQNKVPDCFQTNKQLLNSYLNFGFPFVGDHWIPHFTISSLKVDENHKIIKEFLSDEIDVSFAIDKISLWDVNGNKHKIIEEVKLK